MSKNFQELPYIMTCLVRHMPTNCCTVQRSGFILLLFPSFFWIVLLSFCFTVVSLTARPLESSHWQSAAHSPQNRSAVDWYERMKTSSYACCAPGKSQAKLKRFCNSRCLSVYAFIGRILSRQWTNTPLSALG